MTRRQLNRKLRTMNGVRDALRVAESERERDRLNRKYAALTAEVTPYTEGREKLDDQDAAA